MKVLIVSDTHKSHKNLEKVIEEIGNIDLMIHLGDVEGGDDYLAALVNCPVHFIRGNNDFFSDLPGEKEIFVDGLHIFLTHGHYYYVSMSEDRIKEEARGRGADIVMYGHTHKPSYSEEDGLIVLNPGSIAYPRQEGRRPTYMLMETNPQGHPNIQLMYV